MTKDILHILGKGVQLTLVALLLGSCFGIDKELFSGLITAKHLWVQMVSVGVLLFLAIHMIFTQKIQIANVDVLVVGLVVWMAGRELFSAMPYANRGAHLINIAIYFSVYLFIRSVGNNKRIIKSVIVIYLLIVSIQATIGLLQLYGFMASYHSLFKITGTFHNPGPFSGFLVSGLPIALGLYLMTVNSWSKVTSRPLMKNYVLTGKQLVVISDQYSVFRKQFWVDLQLRKVLGSEFWFALNRDKLLNYFAQFVIIVLLLVLPAARSRAAWIGGIIGFIYVFYKVLGSKFNVYLQLRKVLGLGFKVLLPLGGLLKSIRKKTNSGSKFDLNKSITQKPELKHHAHQPRTQNSELKHHAHQHGTRFRKIFPKLALVTILIILTTSSVYGLYKFKQGSADGRLLMWQVSWEMIKDKPVLGYGQGGFEANFANYQAEWFKSGNGTEAQALVAGVPDAPFNEVIRIFINYGAIGLMLVLIVVILVLSSMFRVQGSKFGVENSQLDITLKGGLISILVFSFFSYPVDVTPILVQLVVAIGLLANQSTEYVIGNTEYRLLNFPRIATAILFITIIPFATINLRNNYLGVKHWQEANELYQYELYEDASEEFELAMQYLPKPGLLLQMQAKALEMDSKWDEAIQTATHAMNFRSGQIINIVLGDANKALKKYNEAEAAYKQASAMIPHKFFPQYLLAKMFDESGQAKKAFQVASALLKKEIKVESTAIEEMREELNKIIENNQDKFNSAVSLPLSGELNPFLFSTEKFKDYPDVVNTNFIFQKLDVILYREKGASREKEQEATLSQNVALPVRPPLLNNPPLQKATVDKGKEVMLL